MNMYKENTLRKIVTKINLLPDFFREKALTTFFGKTVKFTGTSGIRVEELTDSRAVVSVKNRKTVQNHIGSVHAVANLLIAESATGYLVGMHITDSSVPVIKTLKGDYVKRAKGNMRAEAVLTDDQIQFIRSREKGEIPVKVTITDAEQKEPVLVEAIWAWTPKKRH